MRTYLASLAAAGCAATILLTGCTTNSQVVLPGPGAVPAHLYVSDAAGGLHVFQLPLTASSTSIQTLTASGTNVLSIAAGSTGTIYAAEDVSSTCCVDVYQGGATSPSFTLSGASVNDPFGVAVDTSGNVFVANDTGSGSIGYFAAPVHSGQAGIVFGRDIFNEGLITDASDNLYVADGNGTGTMDIYHPPYTVSSMPANTVTLTGTLDQMALGSDGTMYAPTEFPNQLYALLSPYTSVSVTTPVTFKPYGIAVGP